MKKIARHCRYGEDFHAAISAMSCDKDKKRDGRFAGSLLTFNQIFSKSSAPCLHSGQMKSGGRVSPS